MKRDYTLYIKERVPVLKRQIEGLLKEMEGEEL
jgi:hypothetical protein